MYKYLILLILILISLTFYVQSFINCKTDAKIIKYFKKQFKPTGKLLKDDKIFVSVASYRDPQLKPTISNMLSNCSDISKIRVVVCEQNSKDDDFNLEDGLKNVEIIKMKHTDARGPTWARYLIQKYWKGEQYYLQIDSHTRFVKNWDVILKEQLNILPEKSCLSNYVSTYDIKTEKVLKKPLRGPMFIDYIDKEDKFYRFNSNYIDENSINEPQPSCGWSGCFSFSSSEIILDVPYDPYLPFIFFGEEMDIYTRLLNKKWNLYVPSKPICFTLFDRSYRKTFWEHPDCKEISKSSRFRLHSKLKFNNMLFIPKIMAFLKNKNMILQDIEDYC